MKRKVVIAPSILGVKIEELPDVVEELIAKGADIIHFDVMDGKFVPNTSFGLADFDFVKQRVQSTVVFDVHLMVEDVKHSVEDYLNSYADIITFHYEAVNKFDIPEIVKMIHDRKKKAGISIKPDTSITVLNEYLELFDLVLVMSVEPGAGGQKFNEAMLEKVKYLDSFRKEHNLKYVIEIDGGINNVTGKLAVEAGVDYLVAGSYIIKAADRKQAIESLK